MEFFRSLRRSILRLPERMRFFLALGTITVAAIAIFISWSAITASKLAALSPAISRREHQTRSDSASIEGGSVLQELFAGFRDLRALISGGLPQIPVGASESREDETATSESPKDTFRSDWLEEEFLQGATTSLPRP